MTWYVIKWDGQTYTENLSGADEKVLTGLGIHGYATEALAQAHPQTMNDIQAAAGGANVLSRRHGGHYRPARRHRDRRGGYREHGGERHSRPVGLLYRAHG